MTPMVVDSSVAVKWVVPEADADLAARLRGSLGYTRHAPEFLLVEVGNILWKKARRGEPSAAEAASGFDVIRADPIDLRPDAILADRALAIALETDRSVYDCLYVALAVRLGAEVVTADDRLVNALAGTRWAGRVRRLADVP